jgi:hypothetical protein
MSFRSRFFFKFSDTFLTLPGCNFCWHGKWSITGLRIFIRDDLFTWSCDIKRARKIKMYLIVILKPFSNNFIKGVKSESSSEISKNRRILIRVCYSCSPWLVARHQGALKQNWFGRPYSL